MSNWQLSEIQNKVRRVTGRLTDREISDLELNNYINQFYQYTFPADAKLERSHTYYEFVTSANTQDYTLPSGYTNFEPKGTIDRMELDWYQDPEFFNSRNPYSVTRITLGTGDGSTTGFTTTLDYTPILPETVVVTDNTETFEDENTSWTTATVALTASAGGSGTVNYSTGVVSVTFNTAPSNGQDIYLSFVQFAPGRPTAVLNYNNVMRFYPVPDSAYRFQCKAYANNLVQTAAGDVQPFFENSDDSPLLNEWGPCIAYGASRDINSDYGEMDAYAENTALYKEQLAYVMRRTHQNLLNVRSQPHF